ncbi:hypothetical protein Ahu01nite_046180 [Winogradskya humida]|uniref:Uncharacterized protein n=1 Tax=Winogradskya humida TaxID=113566 RepID=A0ABQ3ZSH4_9ACTN|nr:hypothetical protein Ahu01nite_046180 [Actinoplanes humidus]
MGDQPSRFWSRRALQLLAKIRSPHPATISDRQLISPTRPRPPNTAPPVRVTTKHPPTAFVTIKRLPTRSRTTERLPHRLRAPTRPTCAASPRPLPAIRPARQPRLPSALVRVRLFLPSDRLSTLTDPEVGVWLASQLDTSRSYHPTGVV